jgi:hypothetical protein
MNVQIGPEGIGIVKLDGSGNGKVGVGPLTAREKWRPDNVHVSAATHTNEATCSIYAGEDTTQKNFRDTTFSGSTGDSSDRVNADVIGPGAKVWAIWTGGDANVQAILRVTGSKDV